MRHGSADLVVRPRRLRRTPAIRRLVQETSLSASDFILPLFVLPGSRKREAIASMPGVYRLSADLALREAEAAARLGIAGVILFGLPSKKDPSGSEGWSDRGAVQVAVRMMKKADLPLAVITDVCMCEYTSHGHCGILHGHEVHNDATLPLLARIAVSHARAGADLVAPSDMMDGRVAAIRAGLDRSGFSSVGILSYAAKYASAFYGPFRDAAGSVPSFGDRKGYQMDPPNAREALREIALDISEGADLVMVKPALSYLDIIHRAKARFDVPVFAYNVSGEYAMVKAAASHGWVEERRSVLEILTSIKRAGADRILTYHAVDAARWLRS